MKSSPAQAIRLLINAAVGAGVLSLPYAFRCAGWAGGILVLVSVAATESFTLYVLSRHCDVSGANTYGELIYRTLGPDWSVVSNIIIFLYLFGSGVAYLVILGDCFHPLATGFGGFAWYTSRHVIIASTATVFVLPLCFAETLSAANAISSVNLVAFIFVIAAIFFRSVQTATSEHHSGEPFAHPFSGAFLQAIPIAIFGLQCHAQITAVYNELTDDASTYQTLLPGCWKRRLAAGEQSRTHRWRSTSFDAPDASPWLQQQQQSEAISSLILPRTRRKKSQKLLAMTKVIMIAVGITAIGYAAVGLSAYMAFPDSVESNVLKNFSPMDTLMQLVRFTVGILEIASYPVNHLPARHAIRDIILLKSGLTPGGRGFIALETLTFFLGTLGLALMVEDLGSIFSLIGGTCGSVIILGLPGVLLIKYALNKRRAGWVDLQRAANGTPHDTDEDSDEADGTDPQHILYIEYHVWQSKLFWTGMLLVAACLGLVCYTILRFWQEMTAFSKE